MIEKLLSLFIGLTFLTSCLLFSQEQQKQDKEEFPHLEIPEITIVGKKAITLPFARKGEIFGATIYEATSPDSSILLDVPTFPLPIGTLPQLGSAQHPWRLSLAGGYGSLNSGNIYAYADHKKQALAISGEGGYRTTDGYVDNASGTLSQIGVNMRSIIHTDNDILKSLRVSGGMMYHRESYGLFGHPVPGVRRTQNSVNLVGNLGSLYRKGTSLDVSVKTSIWSVTDAFGSVDSQVSIISPDIRSSFASNILGNRWVSELTFASSQLDYGQAVESPSLLTLSTYTRLNFIRQWLLQLGGTFGNGSDSFGESQMLVAPMAWIQWDRGTNSSFEFWYRPEMMLLTYGDRMMDNRYLINRVALSPERKPINLGGSFHYNREKVTSEIGFSYSQSSNKGVVISDSGRLRLEYLDAIQSSFWFHGSLQPRENVRFKISGTLMQAHEKGGSEQLPMIPYLKFDGRGEVDLNPSINIWSAFDFWTKQNVDRLGNQFLDPVVLVGSGVVVKVTPRALFLLEVKNMLNSAYQWWDSYSAPGRRFLLEAKVNLL